jgi:phosphohistidine phosphatase SixA
MGKISDLNQPTQRRIMPRTLTFLIPLMLFLVLGMRVQASDLAPPPFVEKPMTKELLREMRKGGYVLYLRHGTTDNSRPDRIPSVDLTDCSTQRPLSDEGRTLMKQVGRSLREARIPLSRILVSPMCRTLESAQLAIGDQFEVMEPLMYSANMTSAEKKPRIAALKRLMQEPVPKGGNTLFIAHAPNMADLIGFFIKPEGNLLVFRQDGSAGFEYLASIHPNDWATLAK